MKTKIHQRFLDNALNIRKSYKKSLTKIKEKEKIISYHKNEIIKITLETTDFVKKNDIIDDEYKKIFNDKLMDIENNIVKIQNELKPISDDIENIENKSKSLYNNIKDYYPDLEEIDIQNQIIDYLKINNILDL